MQNLLATFTGKLIYLLTRALKTGGGSAAPGLYALKINPAFIQQNIQKIPQNIIITGTNGKTTTSKMLAHFAKASGLKVIRNSTGSNLERGIASALIANSSNKFDIGIWEADEAAFNNLASKINPRTIIFLNLFRDQMDRYGEVDSIFKKWAYTLKELKNDTAILINGDDNNTLNLQHLFKGKSISFGVENYKIKGEGLGKNEKLDFEARNVRLNGLEGTSFFVLDDKKQYPVKLSVPGIYHIYDFLAAFAAGLKIGLKPAKMIASLESFSPAFGRVEKFTFQQRGLEATEGYIFLIKNPTGATQVFKTVAASLKPGDRILFALNDNLADGTDVSWIWDANFEILPTTNYQLPTICSGTRAYDIANRVKYSGVEANNITIEPNLKKAFKDALKGLNGQLFVFPTYTAMLELQKTLVELGIKKHYWKEKE